MYLLEIPQACVIKCIIKVAQRFIVIQITFVCRFLIHLKQPVLEKLITVMLMANWTLLPQLPTVIDSYSA